MKIEDAKAAFDQNVSMLNPQKDPVQWNLNRGLATLCEAIQQVQSQQLQLDTAIAQLQNSLLMRK